MSNHNADPKFRNKSFRSFWKPTVVPQIVHVFVNCPSTSVGIYGWIDIFYLSKNSSRESKIILPWLWIQR